MKILEQPLVGREAEITRFQTEASNIIQGRGEDAFLLSRRGMGKSTLLQGVKDLLFWGEKELVPIYFSFSRTYTDLLDFAEDYLVSIVSQFLVFDQKERLALRPDTLTSISGIKQEAERQGKDVSAELIMIHQKAAANRDEKKALRNALSAPQRMAQAGHKPVWMMVDHIQAIETPPFFGKDLAGQWREVLGSPWAPHLFSGEPPGYLLKIILPAFNPLQIAVWDCPPLPVQAGAQWFHSLGEQYRIRITSDLADIWSGFLEGNPGLATVLLLDARRQTPEIESHQRFMACYLKSLWQGGLGRWFESEMLQGMKTDPGEGPYLLKALHFLWKSGETVVSLAELQQVLALPTRHLQPLLALLERAGLVRESFGNFQLENSRVLRDWVEVLVRKHLFREEAERAIALMGKRLEETLSFSGEKSQPSTSGQGLAFTLVLPIQQDSELVAARALEQIATYSNMDEAGLEKMKLALIEACINAREHSQSFEKKIRIGFAVRPEAIEVVVEDRGQAFDPLAVQARLVRNLDPSSQKRGQGIFLIKALMDEVRFEKTETGTRLHMVKKNPNKEQAA
ncbi:MAG: ATP-binding protein [Thermodesulfobacteriota bacterium]